MKTILAESSKRMLKDHQAEFIHLDSLSRHRGMVFWVGSSFYVSNLFFFKKISLYLCKNNFVTLY